MLIDALHATLENRPNIFNRVCVNGSTDILIARVNDGVVFRKLFASLGVNLAFVGVQD